MIPAVAALTAVSGMQYVMIALRTFGPRTGAQEP
jgi:hypothetical protein